MLYREKDYLAHYGVKGMRWGHRKNLYDVNASYYNRRAGKLESKAKRNRLYAGMNRAAAKRGSVFAPAERINADYYSKRAAKLSSKADKNRAMARMNEAASKQRNEQKQAKIQSKQAVKSTYREMQKNATTKEKLLYNNATRKLAAKYVVNNNMSVSDAKKKANKVAIRNTALIVGAYGATTMVELYKLNKR